MSSLNSPLLEGGQGSPVSKQEKHYKLSQLYTQLPLLLFSGLAGLTMAYGLGVVSKVSADSAKIEDGMVDTITGGSAALNFWLCAYALYGTCRFLQQNYWTNRKELAYRDHKFWLVMMGLAALAVGVGSFFNAHALTYLVLKDKETLPKPWNLPTLLTYVSVLSFRALMLARSVFVIGSSVSNQLRVNSYAYFHKYYPTEPKWFLPGSKSYEYAEIQQRLQRATRRGDLSALTTAATKFDTSEIDLNALRSALFDTLQNLPEARSDRAWRYVGYLVNGLSWAGSAYLSYMYVGVQMSSVAFGLGKLGFYGDAANIISYVCSPFMFLFPWEWIKNGFQKIALLTLQTLINVMSFAYILVRALSLCCQTDEANLNWRWQLYQMSFKVLQLGFAGFLLYISYFAGAEYARVEGKDQLGVVMNGLSGSLMNAVPAYELGEKFAELILWVCQQVYQLSFQKKNVETDIRQQFEACHQLGDAMGFAVGKLQDIEQHPLRAEETLPSDTAPMGEIVQPVQAIANDPVVKARASNARMFAGCQSPRDGLSPDTYYVSGG